MANRTKIEWATHTSNPLRAKDRDDGELGYCCVKVSPGCKHCYAETMNRRFWTGQDFTSEGMSKIDSFLDVKELESWRRRNTVMKRCFLCSMTDMFGEWVEDAFLAYIFMYMYRARSHNFLILTKRAKRMAGFFSDDRMPGYKPLKNVWLGVSVESQKYANDRIESLLATPAAYRFISVEPLLGQVDLRLEEYHSHIDWVLIGGESGPGARRMSLDNAIEIVAECRRYEIPVFVKQLGTAHYGWGTSGTSKGEDISKWPRDLRYREIPGVLK